MSEQAQVPVAQVEPQLEQGEGVPEKVVVDTVDEGQPEQSYKIVRTATGKNYVEANDYDPLEPHRSRDPKANKGQGLGFMFCCCSPQTKEEINTGAEP